MSRPSIWIVTPELHRGSSERAVAEQVGRWRSRYGPRVHSMSAGSWRFAGAEARIVYRAARPPTGALTLVALREPPPERSVYRTRSECGRARPIDSRTAQPRICWSRLRVRIRTFRAMEALAFGLPLVVSRRAGVSELVEDDKHALVVDVPEDVGELAPAIGRALDAGLASWLTQNGRELTER